MTAVINDAVTVFVRQSLPSLRDPFGLIFGMAQPLVFLVFFGPLLTGLVDVPGMDAFEGSAWSWFVPAVLIMLALFGTTGTGYMLLTEMQTGSHERLMVTPMNRVAMLAGRTLNDVVTLVVQALLILAVMVPFGVRFHLVGSILGLVLLAVLGLGVGALSHALAIACRKNHETFYAVQQTLLFPLLFLSGLMLPLDLAPRWMVLVAAANPITYIADATRALFDGQVLVAEVSRGVLMVVGLAVAGLWLGSRGMRRAQP